MIAENYKNDDGQWARCVQRKGVQCHTQSGVAWNNIVNRCKPNGYMQKNGPSYIGCTMSDSFKDFQFFAEWHMQQIGFGLPNYHLDKDILVAGNKLYSENTCALVPSSLNQFLTANNAVRGPYPQGVNFDKTTGMFMARLRIDNKSNYLGLFKTPEEAAQSYKSAKEAEARRWASRLEAGEYTVDQRVIDRLKVWALPTESNSLSYIQEAA